MTGGLFGSMVLPSTIQVGARMVQLGDIVRRAHMDSELSVEDWNDLETLEREMWLVAVILKLRAEAERGFDA